MLHKREIAPGMFVWCMYADDVDGITDYGSYRGTAVSVDEDGIVTLVSENGTLTTENCCNLYSSESVCKAECLEQRAYSLEFLTKFEHGTAEGHLLHLVKYMSEHVSDDLKGLCSDILAGSATFVWEDVFTNEPGTPYILTYDSWVCSEFEYRRWDYGFEGEVSYSEGDVQILRAIVYYLACNVFNPMVNIAINIVMDAYFTN